MPQISKKNAVRGVNKYFIHKSIPVNQRWDLLQLYCGIRAEFSHSLYKDACLVVQNDFGKFVKFLNNDKDNRRIQLSSESNAS